MKIAITGARGFIGSYITPQLKHSFQPLEDRLETLKLEAFLKDAPVLIHLVNQMPTGPSQVVNADQEKVYFQNCVRLFEGFKSIHPSGKIIFASTGGEMYDESNPGFQEEEDAKPCTPYARHKLSLENYLTQLSTASQLQCISLRIGNPFIFKPERERQRGLVPVAIDHARSGQELRVFEHLDSTKDYFHMQDLADVISRVIDKNFRPGRHEVFNVGSGVSSSITSVVKAVEAATGKKIRLQLQNEGVKPKYNSLDISKIRTQLNWTPTYSLKTGIEELLK